MYRAFLELWTPLGTERKAVFDDFISFKYSQHVDELGSWELTFGTVTDERLAYFITDSRIQCHISVPGITKPGDSAPGIPFVDFVGLFRTPRYQTNSDGSRRFIASGYDLNHLLKRTVIAYNAGTVQSDKSAAAETALKEYVYENCGGIATLANGRWYDGVMPNFNVQTDTGFGGDWQGSRSAECLLDVANEIAIYYGLDFNVVQRSDKSLWFETYPGQMGQDRTDIGYDDNTGRNAAGNIPVEFSIPLGTAASMSYEINRLNEANIVYVLGPGDGATQEIIPLATVAIGDSPYNRCEVARPASNQEFYFQRVAFGQQLLVEYAARETFEFTPLDQYTNLYGLHYNLGDKIIARFGSIKRYKRIVGKSVTIQPSALKVSLEFSDL